MAKGFGKKILDAKFQVEDFLDTGKFIKVGRSKTHYLIEVFSGAKAVGKDVQHLANWCSRNGVELLSCRNGEKIEKCIPYKKYMRFVDDEFVLDNPHAGQIIAAGVDIGADRLMDDAIAKGQDYVDIAGQRIPFTMVDGQPYFTTENVAKMYGMSVEKLEGMIKSGEVDRYVRSTEGWW